MVLALAKNIPKNISKNPQVFSKPADSIYIGAR
jgi:hypothetical protein